MAAADARVPLSRSRVVVARGLVHTAQVAGLAVFLFAFADLPWAAAAAPSILRVAASFLAPPRLYFLAAQVILIALATLFRRDAASSLSSPSSADPPGSPSSSGDAQHPFLALLGPPLPPVAEAEPSGEEAPPEVFEDKEAVHHAKTVRAQPPRRAMSEKTGGGAAGRAARAASPELRHANSETGRRRQRRSSSAAAELGMDDAEAFRLAVEAFIAKQQTWFHREESLVAHAAAASGEDGTAITGAVVAVK